ncbi:thiamine pyrophosphate-binding protein [Streptosporangiaceae bacterium NEAU-GS5]|nr:thiamine pyrophosphate-binding protein [Streptosporangiaceae bacterium NEAU-GS5]
MTTIFSNPGSTEISLLAGLPDDLAFVLALHEGSVVGMATGYALASRRPALALLHTTAGLGSAVGAIATARVNRAPLVIVVGQQDRRHLTLEPFLSGRLVGLAGEYPVWVGQPACAQEVPGMVARACHEAVTGRGPALVIVPMDDWRQPAGDVVAAPRVVIRAEAAPDVTELAELLTNAERPALVVGSGADSPEAWQALVALAERLRCPVWQEAFGARAGFPQDHPQWAGVIPHFRSGLRAALSGHDVVLAVGTPAFRQNLYEPGPLVEPGTTVAVAGDLPDDVHRSAADLALLGSPALICARLAELVPARGGDLRPRPQEPGPYVFDELAARLAPETILVEECPSARPELNRMVLARQPLGYVSAAMGGLGFGLPAAIGLRMAGDRPVVAVVGDGSAMYGIQALWSAAHYRVGCLFVVLSNGRYAVMDQLAEGRGKPPWPAFPEVSVAALARAQGCPAVRVESREQLAALLDDVIPGLAERAEPLVLDIKEDT